MGQKLSTEGSLYCHDTLWSDPLNSAVSASPLKLFMEQLNSNNLRQTPPKPYGVCISLLKPYRKLEARGSVESK